MIEAVALDQQTTAILAGLLLANLGVLFGAYASLITRLTRIETKMESVEKDLNGIGGKLRLKD
jgi:hypothetical protein